jgi:hypothetical protein
MKSILPLPKVKNSFIADNKFRIFSSSTPPTNWALKANLPSSKYTS